MNKLINLIVFLAVLAALVVFSGLFYTVDETQQAVITQFGRPVGRAVSQAGLHVKMPFVQKANYFDKRILSWDGDPNQIPTRDKRYIHVDTTARWRIVDPLKFMQSVGTESAAQARLDDIIDAATRDAISGLNLVEAIRSSNRIVESLKAEDEDHDMQDIGRDTEKISVGREKLVKEILQESSQTSPTYGIEIVDVRIKRINYVEDVRKKVYERMISERKRAAERFRSEGQGKKAEIEGQMAKELKEIRSEAYRKAQEIKGKADAQAIKIYAGAYNQDPEFYAFVKSLETYKKTIGKDTTLILDTDSDFFEYLTSAGAGPDPAASVQP